MSRIGPPRTTDQRRTLPFDVCGPLPTGITVLEASAGTGKTFTIAALAARYVAEGVPLERLLLVTFTRMATGELRHRVRQRLVTAEQGLAHALAGVAPSPDDDVLCLLADGPPDQVDERRRRLAAALADFDAATIATTHGFCEHVLSGLGVAGDVDADVEFLEDPTDLVEDVVDDLYVRRFHRAAGRPALRRAEALKVGQTAVDNHDARIEPTDAPIDSVDAMRVRLATAVRAELERRKRRAGVLTYDDLLTRLAATLRDGERGRAACARLRRRYHVALIDEFQDTDPTQWDILRQVFSGGSATLVLVGDPKQAVYAFRGADVYAYLAAADQAHSRATLATNWRSDQGLVDAYDALFAGAGLGHPGIVYRLVSAAGPHQTSRLHGAPVAAPLRVRVLARGDVRLTATGYASTQPARERIAADLAADVAGLLSAGAAVEHRRRNGSPQRRDDVLPGSVAVLVRRNRDAALVRDALDTAGIPAVVNGSASVFATPAATDWLRLLEALERPTAPIRARTAALTAFLGWSAERIATASVTEWEEIHGRLHRWADLLSDRGVAALQEAISSCEGLPGRLLARPDGERLLTDLRHVGELLHVAASGEQPGPTALAAWLRQRIDDAPTGAEAEDRSRRLESDADAVQVLTIHRSKGLEFPVVYCPFLWDPSWIPDDGLAVFHDRDRGNRRTIDVRGKRSPAWRWHVEEQRGEELRLAYVALTRARHQAVIWWAGSWNSCDSALGRLLFARQADGTVAAWGDKTPADDAVLDRFTDLADAAPGCVTVETVTGPGHTVWRAQRPAYDDLRAARFDRRLDRRWRRTSYSAITAGSHQAQGAPPRVASEPETDLVADETMPGPPNVTGEEAAGQESRLRAVPSPLADLPGGAAVGTFVHRVLETADFAAADLDAELAARVGAVGGGRALDIGDPRAVVAGLRAAIETPLGPALGGARLRDFARADRVDELAFELPLVGGDDPTAELPVAAVAELLRTRLPAGDPFSGYATRLAEATAGRDLRGYLAGSLDLVLRMRAGDGTWRFTVVDYKTNRLGVDGEALSAWHYRPAVLAEAMQLAHYPLQALLYVVALHRYLRWRVPGYTPQRHLGGVAYLFLRGMTGPASPRVGGQPCGVFTWTPPEGLIPTLNDLLDRGGQAT